MSDESETVEPWLPLTPDRAERRSVERVVVGDAVDADTCGRVPVGLGTYE